MTAFEWKTFFVWRVTYICVHVTQAQILLTSSKHVSPGMRFLELGIGGLSHQSCMSLHIGTNNIVGGSINGWNWNNMFVEDTRRQYDESNLGHFGFRIGSCIVLGWFFNVAWQWLTHVKVEDVYALMQSMWGTISNNRLVQLWRVMHY